MLDKRDGHLSNIVICLYDVQAALLSTGHNLQAHKMQRILSFQVSSFQERINWAFSVKTENINQKLLLCFLASISDELNYFEWPLSPDDCLMQSLSNMTYSDIGHAYNGLLRIGLVSFCRWDCNVNTLNIENKTGAEF